jgi:hypothetical protein
MPTMAKKTVEKKTVEQADKKPGRPAGSTDIREVATAEPSRCSKCQSTERTPYTNKTEKAIAGLHEGKPYTHVVWRSTTCAGCSQARRDRSYEHRPAE